MPSTLYERAKKKSIWKNIDEDENMKKINMEMRNKDLNNENNTTIRLKDSI